MECDGTDERIVSGIKDRFARRGVPQNLCPPLCARDEAYSLASLGFAPPFLYLRLMREVGNGGFGPGYGLMGLAGGWGAFRGMTAIGTYHWLREEDDGEDLMPGEAPCPPDIPEAMLPVCHLGCGVYVCVDCRRTDGKLWCYDPARDADLLGAWELTLAAWLMQWLSGSLPVQFGGR